MSTPQRELWRELELYDDGERPPIAPPYYVNNGQMHIVETSAIPAEPIIEYELCDLKDGPFNTSPTDPMIDLSRFLPGLEMDKPHIAPMEPMPPFECAFDADFDYTSLLEHFSRRNGLDVRYHTPNTVEFYKRTRRAPLTSLGEEELALDGYNHACETRNDTTPGALEQTLRNIIDTTRTTSIRLGTRSRPLSPRGDRYFSIWYKV